MSKTISGSPLKRVLNRSLTWKETFGMEAKESQEIDDKYDELLEALDEIPDFPSEWGVLQQRFDELTRSIRTIESTHLPANDKARQARLKQINDLIEVATALERDVKAETKRVAQEEEEQQQREALKVDPEVERIQGLTEEQFAEELDWDSGEEADQRRQEELQANEWMKQIGDLVLQINELNGEIVQAGGQSVSTPHAEQYAEATLEDEEEFNEALENLNEEKVALTSALEVARQAAADRQTMEQRLQELRRRIKDVKMETNVVNGVYGAQPVPTPTVDRLDGVQEISEQEFTTAINQIEQEARAVSEQLEGLEEDVTEEVEEKLKARQRAESARRMIFDVLDDRRTLEGLAEDLFVDLGDWPAYDHVEAQSLTATEFDNFKIRVVAEKQALQQRINLLTKRKRWKPGELTDLGDEAQTAFDDLATALKTNGPLDAVTARGWIQTLNDHATQRAKEINDAQVRINMELFLDESTEGKTKRPPKPTLKLMGEFAEKYSADEKELKTYLKLYKELAQALSGGTAPVVRNGIVTLEKLKKALPTGQTGGQRYTKDKSTTDEAGTTYDYHLSVAFSITLGKKSAPDMATVTKAHVSFKTDTRDYKYWYKISKGTFTFENPSGGAPGAGKLRNVADSLLRVRAPKFGCTF